MSQENAHQIWNLREERSLLGNIGRRHTSETLEISSDVNKDWSCKDKDQAYKDQDKDKD